MHAGVVSSSPIRTTLTPNPGHDMWAAFLIQH